MSFCAHFMLWPSTLKIFHLHKISWKNWRQKFHKTSKLILKPLWLFGHRVTGELPTEKLPPCAQGDRRIALVICLPTDCLLEDCPSVNCRQIGCLLEDCSRPINYILEDCLLENCSLQKVAPTKFSIGKLIRPSKLRSGKLPTPPKKAFIFSFYLTIRL